jgi:hypothetical protein
MFAARAVLEATTVEEAIDKATPQNRASGYNHLLAQSGGELGNLETTAAEADYLPGENDLSHQSLPQSTVTAVWRLRDLIILWPVTGD